ADGTVKVLDFGLAKALESRSVAALDVTTSPTLTVHTQAGVILGTAAYMSPEQAKGIAVDKRADLSAFGAVLYEMLTGRRALRGEGVSDTMARALMEAPDWAALPATTPAPIRRLLSRSLQQDRPITRRPGPARSSTFRGAWARKRCRGRCCGSIGKDARSRSARRHVPTRDLGSRQTAHRSWSRSSITTTTSGLGSCAEDVTP